LANVVDDYLMKISHVIRGEEWLPSAPTHVLLYRFLGWETSMPQFAHLPLLLKPSGDGKLSKRDGEAHGFPVFPLAWTDAVRGLTIPGFKEEGYLPEALLNFLALLGWNPGTEQEMFTLEQLVDAFSLDRIGKAGTRFDIQKAKWFNHHYLQLKDDSFFSETVQKVLSKAGLPFNQEALPLWVGLVKSRSTFLSEFEAELEHVCFPPQDFDPELVAGKWNSESRNAIELFLNSIPEVASWEANSIKAHFFSTLEKAGLKPGKFLLVLRLIMTGKGAGPDLMTLLELLGAKTCSLRLQTGLDRLQIV
jgi:glutamyl-tRNA synthetase